MRSSRAGLRAGSGGNPQAARRLRLLPAVLVLPLCLGLLLGAARPGWTRDQRRFAAEAAAQLSLGNAAAALKEAEDGLRQDPADAWLHILAARSLLAQGRPGPAWVHLRQALSLQPQDIVAKTLLEELRQHAVDAPGAGAAVQPEARSKPEPFAALKSAVRREAAAEAPSPCGLALAPGGLLLAPAGEGATQAAAAAKALARAFAPFGQTFLVEPAMAAEPQAVPRLMELSGAGLCLVVRAAPVSSPRLVVLEPAKARGPGQDGGTGMSLDVVNAADPLELARAGALTALGRTRRAAVSALATDLGKAAGLPVSRLPQAGSAWLAGADLELQVPASSKGGGGADADLATRLARALAGLSGGASLGAPGQAGQGGGS